MTAKVPTPPKRPSFAARVLQVEEPAEIARELARTGCEPEGVGIMTKKGSLLPVAVKGVPLKAAPLLKQEMLALGADSAHHKEVASLSIQETDVVLLATPSQYARLFHKLQRQPFRLPQIGSAIETALSNYTSRQARTWKLAGGRTLKVGTKTLVMGVLNVTPDSFSDGGQFDTPDRAVRRALEMVEEGADLLDIGGESTRPGATPVSSREELRRILPVVERVSREVEVPLSIDTTHPEVARAALRAGAHVLNDVSGLGSLKMCEVVREFGAGAIVLHRRGTPATMQEDTEYRDLRGEVYEFLLRRTERARELGIGPEQLAVDPGLGFGKSFQGNLDLLRHVGEFRSLGYPVLLGASRKSFIGVLAKSSVPGERRDASVGAAVAAALGGAQIVRVHDVGSTVRALAVADALRR